MRPYTEELTTPQVVAESLIPAGAGFGIRFLARLIDLIYGFLLGFIAGILTGILLAVMAAMGRLDPNWPARLQDKSFDFAGFGLGILGAFLYHTFSEGIGGTSLGKLCCGLTVVREDGRPCTLLGAFKRGLVYHWDALFFGLVGYTSMKESPLRQRYGDHWGKTVVVQKKVFKATAGHPGWRILIGILVGTLFWASAACAQILLKAF